MSSLLSFHNLGFAVQGQSLFDNASAQVLPGARVGLVGPNGSGKSTLLKILSGSLEPTTGHVKKGPGLTLCYVPQLPEKTLELSGAEHFQKALSAALAKDPDVLLLDEPTNHLDAERRKGLLNFLKRYRGAIICASHDETLLADFVETIWSIDQKTLCVYNGGYVDFCHERDVQEKARLEKIETIKRQTAVLREKIKTEEKRAAQSRRANARENDRSLIGKMREDGSSTAGRIKKQLGDMREAIEATRKGIMIKEATNPRFFFETQRSGVALSVTNGSVGYEAGKPLIQNISLSLRAGERIALVGENAVGKSTLLKALLEDPLVKRTGEWHMPTPIGYLDQHYLHLNASDTVIEALKQAAPQLKGNAVREHLARFLFRKPWEVERRISQLSGGEKVRLSLALIAAKAPRLLLLDEITNNVDLPTREHITQTLKAYPGTLIVISHDKAFLEGLQLNAYYQVTPLGLVTASLG